MITVIILVIAFLLYCACYYFVSLWFAFTVVFILSGSMGVGLVVGNWLGIMSVNLGDYWALLPLMFVSLGFGLMVYPNPIFDKEDYFGKRDETNTDKEKH